MNGNGNANPGRVLRILVYFRTRPPHKGEFHWILHEAVSRRTVKEGYERDLVAAISAAEHARVKLWREARKG